MLAPNPWHPPERDEQRDSDPYIMIGFALLVIVLFLGALLASIGFALLR